MCLWLRGWPPREMMRNSVASGLGGSTCPASIDPAAAVISPAPTTPKLDLSLVTALPESTQQPL
eukprot:2368337-Prorocentrum_lima.AAC.1